MFTVVRYHWVFVHRWLDSMTNEFTNITVAVFVLGVVLDYGTNITDPVAWHTLVDPHEEGLLGDVHQLGDLRLDFADRVGPAGVTEEAINTDHGVNLDQVTLLQDQLLAGEAVTDLVVNADTGGVLVALKADLFGLGPSRLEVLAGKFFNLPAGHPRPDKLTNSEVHSR